MIDHALDLDLAYAPAAGVVRELGDRLTRVHAGSEAEMVELLDALERLKGAAAARQAEITCALDRVRAEQARWTGRRTGDAGLGAEIGLARRESPHRGRTHLGLARALCGDLPETLALLRTGEISERRAEIVATEARHLTREQRLVLDAELAGRLPDLGEAETLQAARRVSLRLDEAGHLERRSRAVAARRVSTRLLGDGMASLTATLPSETAAAVAVSLSQAVEQHLAAADLAGEPEERSRTQLRADLLAERLLGSVFASKPPVAVKMLVSAETLLADGCEPAWVSGCGHVPATVARHLAARGLPHPMSTAHRVFHFPRTGDLVAMEADGRQFRGLLRELVVDVRDQGRCRTPWCNAPAVHADHPDPARDGGPTTARNGQGLCAGCNYAKESPGWRHEASLDESYRHTVEITTPTGRRHRSHAPPPPLPPPLAATSIARRDPPHLARRPDQPQLIGR